MIRLWREEVQLREATWQELGPLGEVSAGDPAERELEEQTPDLSFLHLSYLLPVPPTRWIQPKPEGKEAHWGRSAFWNTEQRESRPGEANGTYLTTNLFPIMYTNVTALYRKNDNYGRIIQIADFKSLCGFEVRTSMIGGLKIVIVVISVISQYLLGAYFVPGTVLNTSSILTHLVFTTVAWHAYWN